MNSIESSSQFFSYPIGRSGPNDAFDLAAQTSQQCLGLSIVSAVLVEKRKFLPPCPAHPPTSLRPTRSSVTVFGSGVDANASMMAAPVASRAIFSMAPSQSWGSGE